MQRDLLAMEHLPPRNKSRRAPITLDARPITEEQLSAAEFLALSKNNPGIIKSVRLIDPQPGKRGFGTFLVKYLFPRHRTEA